MTRITSALGISILYGKGEKPERTRPSSHGRDKCLVATPSPVMEMHEHHLPTQNLSFTVSIVGMF